MTDVSEFDEAAQARIRRASEKNREEQIARERRRMLPATRGDLERLQVAFENGWVGRGFAIAIGITILNFVLALVLMFIWASMISHSSSSPVI